MNDKKFIREMEKALDKQEAKIEKIKGDLYSLEQEWHELCLILDEFRGTGE